MKQLLKEEIGLQSKQHQVKLIVAFVIFALALSIVADHLSNLMYNGFFL